jgi:hypothetical protein
MPNSGESASDAPLGGPVNRVAAGDPHRQLAFIAM